MSYFTDESEKIGYNNGYEQGYDEGADDTRVSIMKWLRNNNLGLSKELLEELACRIGRKEDLK